MMKNAIGRMVVEIWAAVAGASIGVALLVSKVPTAITSMEGIRWCVTSAVDNLASRMDVLHADLRVRDQELFARISDLEQNVAGLRVIKTAFRISAHTVIVMVLLLKPIPVWLHQIKGRKTAAT